MKTEEFKCQKITGSIGKKATNYWNIVKGSDEAKSSIFPSLEVEVNGLGTFIVVARIFNDVFYHWIHFVGSSQEAEKFLYTFEYKNEEKTPHAHNLYSNQAVSIDETSDAIIENGKCFGIPRKLFCQQFVPENKRFEYSVT